MARWNKAIDIGFDFGDSGDDGDDDDGQDYDDEDESGLDDDGSTAGKSSHSTTKAGRAPYGRGLNHLTVPNLVHQAGAAPVSKELLTLEPGPSTKQHVAVPR
jgi:hypothetical protein